MSKDKQNNKKEETKNKPLNEERELVAKIKDRIDLCTTQYAQAHKRMRLLEATDNGDLWKALKAKYPKYQILPDTNYVTHVKNNVLASIYTVAKGASIRPTSKTDRDIIENLNIALDYIWDTANVGYYQFQAGDRAALLNIGITQVGWDETLTGGSKDSFYKGGITLKNINPLHFMMDPFAPDFEHAGYCMTTEKLHKSVFEENPNYKEKFKEYATKHSEGSFENMPESYYEQNKGHAKDYYMLTCFWEKVDGKVNEYHIIDKSFLLYSKKDIKPSEFPFAVLYYNLPNDNIVGVSDCAKIFANNVAINLLDSLALTSVYKNQNPPKFITNQAGLNIQSFAKHGDEAGRAFIVNGKPSESVYYHKFPEISAAMPNLKASLEQGVATTSGVDGRYTGRDTGSILTTGGIEDMLNRVTLIDTPKILLYENYTKRLTKLILANLVNFSQKRKYFLQKPNTTKWDTVEVDFPKIDNDTLFSYAIDISSELPKNKQRIAAVANDIMEKQMQYQQQGSSVQLITEEEWLSMIDLPNKEYMLERMGIQRRLNTVEEVAQVLYGYSDLVENGASSNDAILAMAQSLNDRRQGIIEEPTIPGMITDDQIPEGQV